MGKALRVNCSFSQKPPRGHYDDYYEKMTTYCAILASHAKAIDVSVDARNFVAEPSEEESVFHYMDTASPRARIGAVTAKLEHQKLGIIGLGGTGRYTLDFLAKCPVAEIHLFDGDVFEQHSAFRAPGAPSIDELRAATNKATRFAEIYSRMHQHVIPHPHYVDVTNAHELASLNFVFVCMDKPSVKKCVFDALEKANVPFIDSGLGLLLAPDVLSVHGLVRVTTSTPAKREHVRARVGVEDDVDDAEDAYATNIQIAELNAIAAALAVIKWKKLRGFYVDHEREHASVLIVPSNKIVNGEVA